jgi:hypothetical protein
MTSGYWLSLLKSTDTAHNMYHYGGVLLAACTFHRLKEFFTLYNRVFQKMWFKQGSKQEIA